MQIKSLKNTNIRKRLLIVAAVMLGLILTFMILEVSGVTHFINPLTSKTTKQIKEAEINSKNKQDLIENKSNTSSTGDSTNHKNTPGDITISTRRETDGSVTILTSLNNYSDGTCDLTIKNGNNIYTKTAPVIYQSSFSTCAGFRVSTDAVGIGTWQISLAVTSKGEVITKSISMEIK